MECETFYKYIKPKLLLLNFECSEHTIVDVRFWTFWCDNIILDICQEASECSLVGSGVAVIYTYDNYNVYDVANDLIGKIKYLKGGRA